MLSTPADKAPEGAGKLHPMPETESQYHYECAQALLAKEMRKHQMKNRTLELPDAARVQIFLEFYRLLYSIEQALLHLVYRFDVEKMEPNLDDLDLDEAGGLSSASLRPLAAEKPR